MTVRARLASGLLAAVIAGSAGCKGGRAGAGAADAAPSDGGSADARDAAPDAAPQDDSIPPTSSEELTARARHLLEAMGKDDPDLAGDILFPRTAWLTLRDASDPGKDWSDRVERPFHKALHAASRHHLEGAQFVSLELGHAVVQEPMRHHGWKKPLWAVRGSRLTYVVDGHTRTLSIHEMTAWRGAWYVTRLR